MSTPAPQQRLQDGDNTNATANSAPAPLSKRARIRKIVTIFLAAWGTVQTFIAGLSLCSQISSSSNWPSSYPNPSYTDELIVIYVCIIAQVSFMGLLFLRSVFVKRVLKKPKPPVFTSMWFPISQVVFIPVSVATVSLWAKYTLFSYSTSDWSSSFTSLQITAFIAPTLSFLGLHGVILALFSFKTSKSVVKAGVAVLALIIHHGLLIVAIFSFGYLRKMEAIDNGGQFNLTTRQNLLISVISLWWIFPENSISLFVPFGAMQAAGDRAKPLEQFYRHMARSLVAAVVNLYCVGVMVGVYFSNWYHCTDNVLASFDYCSFQRSLSIIWLVVLLASLAKARFMLTAPDTQFFPTVFNWANTIANGPPQSPPNGQQPSNDTPLNNSAPSGSYNQNALSTV